jgi:autotransporter-associated beta strand protein
MTAGGTTVLSGANTFSGGAEVEGGTLEISGASATAGGGNVTVTGGTLKIDSGVANALANTATLSISGTGIVNLGAGINDLITSLILGGTTQANGTYGSSLSSATNKLDQYFSGTGIITVGAVTIPGDFDHDGSVNGADLVVWKGQYGNTGAGLAADADGNNTVDGADFLVWQKNVGAHASVAAVGAVPEPASVVLVAMAFGAALMGSARRRV